jgi:hypothetical protein
LAPFLGSSIVLQLQNWSSKFGKITVLDSAKPFGWICYFYFYLALSIFSPRVHFKERVVALYWGISIRLEVVQWNWIASYHNRVFTDWQGVEVERDNAVQVKVCMKMIIPKQDKVKRLLVLQQDAQVPEEEEQKSWQKWNHATLSK